MKMAKILACGLLMAALLGTSAIASAEKVICQDIMKNDVIVVSPKKDIVYTFEACKPAEKEAAPLLTKTK